MSRPDPVTYDLGDFDRSDLREAGRLLSAFAKNPNFAEHVWGNETRVALNRNSGCVFLTDDEYNTAMMNDDTLELWHTCSYCGHEGFADDFEHEPHARECVEDMQRVIGDDYEVPEDWA